MTEIHVMFAILSLLYALLIFEGTTDLAITRFVYKIIERGKKKMRPIHVVEWLTDKEVKNMDPIPDCSFGGMGGWVEGDDFAEYLNQVDPKAIPYAKALQKSIVENSIKEGGDWHQHEGIPLFSDGTIGEFSFRGWGDLLACVWNSEEKTSRYDYMDFYMSCLVERD